MMDTFERGTIKDGHKGWTLVELLVVCAIVAVLAGVLFVVGSKAVQTGKESASLSNLSQIGKASFLYAADNDDCFCHQVTFNTISGDLIPGYVQWRDATLPYIKSKDVFFAPNDPLARRDDLHTKDVPFGEVRSTTSYVHTGTFFRFVSLGSAVRLSSIPDHSKQPYMCESGVSYKENDGMLYSVPANGRSVGFVFFDGHVVRQAYLYLDKLR